MNCTHIIPYYPPLARRRGWQGTVVLAIELDGAGHGKVESVMKGSGYTMLDEAAAQTFIDISCPVDGVVRRGTQTFKFSLKD